METKLYQQLEEGSVKALEIVMKSINGEPVNPDRLKDSKFILTMRKSEMIQLKEAEKIELQKSRFGMSIMETYGDKEMKETMREKIKKGLPKMNFVDK